MSSAAKIGAFMLVILGILGFFILKIEDVKVSRTGNHKKVTAIFDSVAGLDKGSAVRVAGVRVGKVTKIDLRDDGKAEVEMEIDKDVQLHANAQAHVANLGLLGEKYVELAPGSPNQPVIGEQKQGVTLPGTQPATIDQVTDQISAIATDVKAITTSLRASIGTPNGQAQLQDIVANVDNITKQVRDLIAANRMHVDETGTRLNTALASVESGVNELKNTLGRIGKLQLDLGMNSDYYAGLPQRREGVENLGGNSRSAVWLRLTPNPAENNRFYNV